MENTSRRTFIRRSLAGLVGIPILNLVGCMGVSEHEKRIMSFANDQRFDKNDLKQAVEWYDRLNKLPSQGRERYLKEYETAIKEEPEILEKYPWIAKDRELDKIYLVVMSQIWAAAKGAGKKFP